MKKVIAVVCALLAVCLLMSPVLAVNYTVEDILSQMRAGITIDGKTNTIPEKHIKIAQDFFNANYLTQEELNTAMNDLLEAKVIWEATGELSFAKIPDDVKTKLQNMAAASAKKVGATLAIDGKAITIVDKAGKTYTVEVSPGSVIKQTGSDYTAVYVFGILFAAAVGAAFVIVKRRKTA